MGSVKTECGWALSCRFATGPGDDKTNFCFWTTLELGVKGSLYVESVERSLSWTVSVKLQIIEPNIAYYSAVAKKLLPSEPPYKAPWTLPPAVMVVERSLTVPSVALENEASTFCPLESSSMQYTAFEVESTVNHEGLLPQLAVEDRIVRLPCCCPELGGVYKRL